MSRRQDNADPVTRTGRGREREALTADPAWDEDDASRSVPPLESARAPLGTHEVGPDEPLEHPSRSSETRIESPAARQRTPARRSRPARRSAPPSDRPEDRVGSVLGSYRLVELIGRGGMGFVYRAEHVKLGREVALKLLRADYARRRDSVARFFQEARTVNRIRHRNIIDVTDFVELDDGTTFIIMELLEGRSLSRWAKDRFDVPRALALLVQICDGLAAAHAVGVIHRDLKPDNIIVLPTGDGAEQVKLLDFGVAKLVHREDEDVGLETAAGSVIGTPAYMSPEQAGGLAVDERSDIYSLGAIMYELFCGQPMFRGRSFGEYVRKHLSEQPVPPRQTARGAHMPDVLEAVILCCIDKEPQLRYGSISALRDDLLALLGGIETLDPAYRPGAPPMPLEAPNPSGIVAPGHRSSVVAPGHRSSVVAPGHRSSVVAPATVDTASGRRRPNASSWPGQALPMVPAPAPRRRTLLWVTLSAAVAAAATTAVLLVVSHRGAGATPRTTAAADTAQPPAPTAAPAPTTAAPAADTAPPADPTPPPPAPVVTAAAPPAAPHRLPLVDVRFDSTPTADVLAAAGATPLCATPCTVTIDPNDGGAPDARAFILHRDGYRDRREVVHLATPHDVRVQLARAAGRSRPPRSKAHRSAPRHPAPPPDGSDTALMAPPVVPPPPKHPPKHHGKTEVDPAATLDPFAQ